MHLTCTNMPKDKLRDALDKVSTVHQANDCPSILFVGKFQVPWRM